MRGYESVTIRQVQCFDSKNKITGKNRDFANSRDEETEEYILCLDLNQA